MEETKNASAAMEEAAKDTTIAASSSNCVDSTISYILQEGDFWLVVVTAALSFWPFPSREPKDLETESSFAAVLDSDSFFDSSIVLLALLLPLTLVLFLDICHSLIAYHRNEMTDSFPVLRKREKLLLYLGFASVPSAIFIQTGYPHIVRLFLCMTIFQMIVVFGTVWVSLCRLNRGRWPRWTVYVGITLWVVGLNMGLQAYMTHQLTGYLNTLSEVIKGVAIYGFFAIPALWFIVTGLRDHVPKLPFFPLLYTLIGTLCFLAAVIALTVLGGTTYYTEDGMAAHNAIMICLELCLIVLHIRKDKLHSALDDVLAGWAEQSLQSTHGMHPSLRATNHHVTQDCESQQQQQQEQQQQEERQQHQQQQQHQRRQLLQHEQQQQQLQLQIAEEKRSIFKPIMGPEPREFWEIKQTSTEPSEWFLGTLASSAVDPSILGRDSIFLRGVGTHPLDTQSASKESGGEPLVWQPRVLLSSSSVAHSSFNGRRMKMDDMD